MPQHLTGSIQQTTEATELCNICDLYHPHLIHNFNPVYEADIIKNIISFFPAWQTEKGICGRCFDEFEAITYHGYRAMEQSVENYKLKFLDFYVLPIIERLNADPFYTGKGVTICFIDNGFYLHPDIRERVVDIVDITDASNGPDYFKEPHESAWHGTMTSTVCAGDGKMSNGLYKGLARDAMLVLLKTANNENKITDQNIVKGLEWVLNNHKRHNIKIVNLSLSGDLAEANELSAINKLAEKLFENDVLVVAAVGNTTDDNILPPASSPHVVAVGGLNDQNKLNGDIILYHSAYGLTIDGLSKPELISNAMWIPAPILPGTHSHQKAVAFFKCLENENYMSAIIENNQSILKDEYINLYEGKDLIWKEIKKIIWKEKFINSHYMHVDGTSFAAPIVTSIAAQMIESNPNLSAHDIRNILLQTALPLPSYDIARQGYGRVQPKMAVYAAMQRQQVQFTIDSPIINEQNKRLTFHIQLPYAKKCVSLVASFNNWKKNEILLKPALNDTWYVEIPALPPGKHEYKFYVDDNYWVEDISNPWRVINTYGGWNNVFEIKSHSET